MRMDFNLIPSAEPFQVSPIIFLGLNIVLFLLHILAINIVVGGLLMLVYFRFFTKRKNDVYIEKLVKSLPIVFPLGINLGVAALLFLQVLYGQFFYTSSILMAVYWISVIPALLIGYYGLYVYSKGMDNRPILSNFAISISLVLVLYILFNFVNNMTLMLRPEKWVEYFSNQKGTILNLSDPMLWPRIFHFLPASVATVSLFIVLLLIFGDGGSDPDIDKLSKFYLRIYAGGSVVQIITGIWFLFSVQDSVLHRLIGLDLAATIFFVVGILAGLGSTVSAFRGNIRPTIIQFLITMACMVITRHNLRSWYLGSYYNLFEQKVEPQVLPLVVFLIFFIGGIGVVIYMIKISFKVRPEGGAR